MESHHLSLKTPAVRICADIAALAGVEWGETTGVRSAAIDPFELDRLDPFFDSVGLWDAVRREVVVDVERCERMRATHPAKVLIEIVAVHFCAKAVVQLGIHPETRKQYGGWDAAEKRFDAERYPLKPIHRFYDPLVREQQLFTQIFTYLHLLGDNDAEELAAFRWLSQGHCGLYALDYCDPPPAILIDRQLVRDWRHEANTARDRTAIKARYVFGWLTRDVSPNKANMEDWDEIDP